MMQVEVPTILTTSPSDAPAPSASQWASNAPTGIGIPDFTPRRAAHSEESVPAILSEVAYGPSIFARKPSSSGSISLRASFEGKPPKDSFQSHLWPSAQTLR